MSNGLLDAKNRGAADATSLGVRFPNHAVLLEAMPNPWNTLSPAQDIRSPTAEKGQPFRISRQERSVTATNVAEKLKVDRPMLQQPVTGHANDSVGQLRPRGTHVIGL